MANKIKIPYTIKDETFQKMLVWLYENIGVFGKMWDIDYVWVSDDAPILIFAKFKKEEDLTIFALKWL
jgi:hypothetical protein